MPAASLLCNSDEFSSVFSGSSGEVAVDSSKPSQSLLFSRLKKPGSQPRLVPRALIRDHLCSLLPDSDSLRPVSTFEFDGITVLQRPSCKYWAGGKKLLAALLSGRPHPAAHVSCYGCKNPLRTRTRKTSSWRSKDFPSFLSQTKKSTLCTET